LLEKLVVLSVPLFVTGDLTEIRVQLLSLFEAFGLQICHSGPTHRDGGVLNLVTARDVVPVSVINV